MSESENKKEFRLVDTLLGLVVLVMIAWGGLVWRLNDNVTELSVQTANMLETIAQIKSEMTNYVTKEGLRAEIMIIKAEYDGQFRQINRDISTLAELHKNNSRGSGR